MLEAKLRSLKIIALAMMVSGLLYSGVLLVVAVGETPPPPSEAMNLGLIAAAFAVLVAILPVRRALLGRLALIPERSRSTDATLPPDALSDEVARVVGRYTTGTIVSLAMAESVILFGFVAATALAIFAAM